MNGVLIRRGKLETHTRVHIHTWEKTCEDESRDHGDVSIEPETPKIARKPPERDMEQTPSNSPQKENSPGNTLILTSGLQNCEVWVI